MVAGRSPRFLCAHSVLPMLRGPHASRSPGVPDLIGGGALRSSTFPAACAWLLRPAGGLLFFAEGLAGLMAAEQRLGAKPSRRASDRPCPPAAARRAPAPRADDERAVGLAVGPERRHQRIVLLADRVDALDASGRRASAASRRTSAACRARRPRILRRRRPSTGSRGRRARSRISAAIGFSPTRSTSIVAHAALRELHHRACGRNPARPCAAPARCRAGPSSRTPRARRTC